MNKVPLVIKYDNTNKLSIELAVSTFELYAQEDYIDVVMTPHSINTVTDYEIEIKGNIVSHLYKGCPISHSRLLEVIRGEYDGQRFGTIQP